LDDTIHWSASTMDSQENKTLTADNKDSSTSKRPREDEQDVTDDTPECSSEPEKTTSVANPSAKMRRILSNREHARASYLRKKKLIEDLKNSVTTLEEENKRLREEVTTLKANQNQSYPTNMGYGSLQGLNAYPRMSSQAQTLSQRRLALLESLSNPNAVRSSPLHLGPLAQNRSWAAEMAASGAPWNDRVAEEMIGGGGMSLPQQQQLQQLQQQQQQLQQRAALLGNPLHFTPGLSQAQQFAAMGGAAHTPYKTLQELRGDVQDMLHDGSDDVVSAALKDNALRRISD